MSRFTKLNVAGGTLAIEATDHVAILDELHKLEWFPSSIRCDSWQEAMDKAEALGDGWRAPTADELASLCDRTRREPACDPALNMPFDDWHWSSSPVVGWPESAWFVDFGYGYVGYDDRVSGGFVRPVRAARARQ